MIHHRNKAATGAGTLVSGYIRLQGACPGYDGMLWAMHEDFQIGRAAGQSIILDDHSVSRAHAGIVLTDQGWIVHDQDSTNGTFVNDERVGEEGRVLEQGDLLRCGKVVLLVAELVDSQPEDIPIYPDE